MVQLKYQSNFWWTLEMSLINCEINLILTWSATWYINQVPTFELTVTKPYIPGVALSTQDNANILQQLESGFKRTINWKKFQSKATIQEQNWYLYYLTDPSFQRVNSFFVLSFK